MKLIFFLLFLMGCTSNYELPNTWNVQFSSVKNGRYNYVYNCKREYMKPCVSIYTERYLIPEKFKDKDLRYYVARYMQDMNKLGHKKLTDTDSTYQTLSVSTVLHELDVDGRQFKTVIFIKNNELYYFIYSASIEAYSSQLSTFDEFWMSMF